LRKASTEVDSVGMVGTYWKLGRRKAEADGVLGTSCSRAMSGSLPGLAAGIERELAACCDGREVWCSGDEVGGKEEVVSITLWYGCHWYQRVPIKIACWQQYLCAGQGGRAYEHH